MPDYRLKKESDFNLIFKKGKRVFSNSLILIYLPSKETKAGYAVSKKHGGSVIRNRIKRLLRESFRSFTPQIRNNFFFVFIPKQFNEKVSYNLETYKKDMLYLFRKAEII